MSLASRESTENIDRPGKEGKNTGENEVAYDRLKADYICLESQAYIVI